MNAPDGARCAIHSEQPAIEICERCGNFLCVDCRVQRESGAYCSGCAPSSIPDVSMLAAFCAILGFFSFGCGPLGIAAIVLGVIDLRRISEGSSPARGRKLDVVGIGLAVVGMAISALLVLSLALANAI